MLLLDLKLDNVTDYCKPSILLVFPFCKGKCKGCHNAQLQKLSASEYKTISPSDVIDMYNKNEMQKAIVMAGLEPLDSIIDVEFLIHSAVANANRDIDFVIYTGYTEEELVDNEYENKLLSAFNKFPQDYKGKLIIKVGRFDEEQRVNDYHSKILGVNLATSNQSIRLYTRQKGLIKIERYGEKDGKQ